MQLRVKLLSEDATLPALGHEGDLGYDIFSSEDVTLFPGNVYKVHTGIAVDAGDPGLMTVYTGTRGCGKSIRAQYIDESRSKSLGLIVKDRSSMAAKGIFTHGGVIDSGYRGEIVVLMTSLSHYQIKKGDKIAQLVPVPVLTGSIEQVGDFSDTSRGVSGFGSTGR